MRNALASLLLVTAVGIGSAAYAADPPQPAKPSPQAATPAGHADHADHARMGGHMMHDMHGGAMDMGAMHCMALSEQRLATVKAELKITEAQTPQWNSFVEAEKSGAGAMRGMRPGAAPGAHPGPGMTMTGHLPERLERQETMMTAHLDALHKVRTAASTLYDVLTPDQKDKADNLLCGGMGGHGPAAREGHAHPHNPQ